MEYKTIGLISLPVLGIGSWRGIWGDAENPTQRPCYNPVRNLKTTSTIREAINHGITHLDTAELYGDGYAEEIIGGVIKGVDRSSLFITSKVKGDHLDYDSIMKAIDGSLQRLGTDYVDLYLVHWPNQNFPISETMRAMDDLVDQGKAKHIGVSNFSLSQMMEAQQCTEHKIAAVQVEYNLMSRNDGKHTKNVESEIIPYCQENGIFVMAYGPLAKGKLLEGQGVGKLLDSLTRKYEKTPSQISLNWLLSKKNLVTIFGTTNLDHMVENLGAIGWEMEPEDLKLLDSLSSL